jgi:Flp pilus assembly pilin Flp
MWTYLRALWLDEGGQDLTEYTLLVAFFALATFAIVTGGFPGINGIWHGMGSHLTSANTSASS